MPRIPSGYSVGHAYHVLNRGNEVTPSFHADSDYAAFLDLLDAAKAQHPVQMFGFCLI